MIAEVNVFKVAELIKERDALRAENQQLRESLRASTEADWTASLCDRLNELVRENHQYFYECKDGKSASDLIQVIHGVLNGIRAENQQLRDQVDKLVKALTELTAAGTALHELLTPPKATQ